MRHVACPNAVALWSHNGAVSHRDDLGEGDRVTILSWSLRGLEGTLVRPARLPNGKRAWLVQLDGKSPLAFRGRTRVAEWSLQKL
jgi:hypothetical protein